MAPTPIPTVKLAIGVSVSVSLAKTVEETVVIVTVPPSFTCITSAIPVGESLTSLTVTRKLSETKEPQLASLAIIVIVALPVILST